MRARFRYNLDTEPHMGKIIRIFPLFGLGYPDTRLNPSHQRALEILVEEARIPESKDH